MKKNNAFLYYCVSTVVLICMLTTWVVYVRFVADTVQNSGFSLNHVASNTISAITKPHTRNTDDILSQAGKEYKNVLENIHGKYKFKNVPDSFKYYYSLWDINNDKIPELIVTAAINKDGYSIFNCAQVECSGNNVTVARVFSYDGNKLVVPSKILSYSKGTMMFERHHNGIVFFADKPPADYPNDPKWFDDRHFPWEKTTYSLSSNDISEKSDFIEYPYDTDKTKGTDELGKVTAPYYLESDDFTEINKLINITTLTSKERQHEEEILKWREQGYQVYDGTISEENFDDHEATVFLFDKKIPIVTATHGTDSALCPPLPIDTKGLLLRDTGNDFGVLDSYFSKYSNTGEKLTIAFKSFYYGGRSNDDAELADAADYRHIIP